MVRFLFLAILLAACDRPVAEPARRPDASTPAATHLRYGPLMIEVGYHLQVLGRAGTAGRWELAAHATKELTELFTEDIPVAEPPPEAVIEVLMGRNHGFTDTTLPVLRQAVQSRDPVKFAQAYGAVVAACNGCHASAGFQFIEVPAEPGAPVPRTD